MLPRYAGWAREVSIEKIDVRGYNGVESASPGKAGLELAHERDRSNEKSNIPTVVFWSSVHLCLDWPKERRIGKDRLRDSLLDRVAYERAQRR